MECYLGRIEKKRGRKKGTKKPLRDNRETDEEPRAGGTCSVSGCSRERSRPSGKSREVLRGLLIEEKGRREKALNALPSASY